MVKRLSDSDWQHVYGKLLVPRLCIDPIVGYEGGVILIERLIPPHVGLWHIAGGGVLSNETIEEAIARLTQDELGIEVDAERSIVLGHANYLPGPEYPRHDAGYFYWVPYINGEPRSDGRILLIHEQEGIPLNIIPQHGEFLRNNWARIAELLATNRK